MTTQETAVFGGGCFWCTEAIFSRLKGVAAVTSGYAGGQMPHPSYDAVSMGTTGHAEVIEIVFDPTIISFTTLLDIFWNTHDPSTPNQQGADVGTQYRSVIFTTTQAQLDETIRVRNELQSHFPVPIVTKIEPLNEFFPAETYHQQYYERQSDAPYCAVVITPKIQKLLTKYSSFVK